MPATSDLDDRLAWLDRVLRTPPAVHTSSPDGVWLTQASCYRFMAGIVGPRSRTLETGAGLSTALFAAWGCDHTVIVPAEDECRRLADYGAEQGISFESIQFVTEPSETALPNLAGAGPLDLVFIDGGHGFPLPIIDWFYAAARLVQGGVVVFDDRQLHQVSVITDGYLAQDPRWERLAGTGKWVAYRRLSTGGLAESHVEQSFFVEDQPTMRKLKDLVPLPLRKAARSLLSRVGSSSVPSAAPPSRATTSPSDR